MLCLVPLYSGSATGLACEPAADRWVRLPPGPPLLGSDGGGATVRSVWAGDQLLAAAPEVTDRTYRPLTLARWQPNPHP